MLDIHLLEVLHQYLTNYFERLGKDFRFYFSQFLLQSLPCFLVLCLLSREFLTFQSAKNHHQSFFIFRWACCKSHFYLVMSYVLSMNSGLKHWSLSYECCEECKFYQSPDLKKWPMKNHFQIVYPKKSCCFWNLMFSYSSSIAPTIFKKSQRMSLQDSFLNFEEPHKPCLTLFEGLFNLNFNWWQINSNFA